MKRAEIESRRVAAQKELHELLQEKALLDMRIGHLAETVQAYDQLLQAKPAEPDELPGEMFGETGITGAIRLLLQRAKTPLSPTQIRDELMDHGFDLNDYANALAVIHNTLKRLDRQGELLSVKDTGGQTYGYTTRFKTLLPDLSKK